jgi:hypothetical protein
MESNAPQEAFVEPCTEEEKLAYRLLHELLANDAKTWTEENLRKAFNEALKEKVLNHEQMRKDFERMRTLINEEKK